ncbi:hypothetical protein V1505DRAFT_148025 [Lipomyces doorenjongii]
MSSRRQPFIESNGNNVRKILIGRRCCRYGLPETVLPNSVSRSKGRLHVSRQLTDNIRTCYDKLLAPVLIASFGPLHSRDIPMIASTVAVTNDGILRNITYIINVVGAVIKNYWHVCRPAKTGPVRGALTFRCCWLPVSGPIAKHVICALLACCTRQVQPLSERVYDRNTMHLQSQTHQVLRSCVKAPSLSVFPTFEKSRSQQFTRPSHHDPQTLRTSFACTTALSPRP